MINQSSHNPKTVENKLNEEQFLQKVNRSKKKKNKSKNHKQELSRNRKINDINLQAANSTRECNENKLNLNGWKEKKEFKIPVSITGDDVFKIKYDSISRSIIINELHFSEIKNGRAGNNFEKTDTSQKKNRKHQNSTKVKKSTDITAASEKNSCVFKKRIVKQNDRQYGKQPENYNFISNNDDHYNLFNTLKNHYNNELCKNDHDKKYQKNRQLKNEKSDEQSKKHLRVVKYINDSYKTNQLSNSIFFKSLNNVEEIPDSNIKHVDDDIKTPIINNIGVKYNKGITYSTYIYFLNNIFDFSSNSKIIKMEMFINFVIRM